MLIVRKPSATDFLLGNGHKLCHFEDLLQRLQTCFKMRNNDPHMRELIVQTCQNHLTLDDPDSGKKDLFLGPIAIAAMAIADQGLFRDAVHSVTDSFDDNSFFILGELICFQAPAALEDE